MQRDASLTWAGLGLRASALSPAFRWRRRGGIPHGGTYEIWPRRSDAESDQAQMALPIDWDTPPAVCGPPPDSNCVARPLYPHTHLLPTGEFFMCAAKCGPSMWSQICTVSSCWCVSEAVPAPSWGSWSACQPLHPMRAPAFQVVQHD